MKPHLRAQQAIVRMLFDAEFAARVRREPEAALPDLPSTLRAQLAAIDPRALKLDRLLRQRTLRTLFDEYKASTTLLLSRTKKLSSLDDFFAGQWFVDVICHHRPLPLAYAAFLHERGGRQDVVQIEQGLVLARRRLDIPIKPNGRIYRAPGVTTIETTKGGLAAMQQAEQYLFEVGMMPAVALCADAPALVLDDRAQDPTPLFLVTVPTETGLSLVTIDEPIYRLLESLPKPPSPALQPLVDDGIAVRT